MTPSHFFFIAAYHIPLVGCLVSEGLGISTVLTHTFRVPLYLRPVWRVRQCPMSMQLVITVNVNHHGPVSSGVPYNSPCVLTGKQIAGVACPEQHRLQLLPHLAVSPMFTENVSRIDLPRNVMELNHSRGDGFACVVVRQSMPTLM